MVKVHNAQKVDRSRRSDEEKLATVRIVFLRKRRLKTSKAESPAR